MRQRHIRNREDILRDRGGYIVEDPKSMKGRWKELFPGCEGLYLEIGSGKGQFISGMAERWPHRAFLACEGQFNVYPRILQKIGAKGLENLRLISEYITDPCDLFEDGELDGIYLNFSDPWKKRTANRRLTYRGKLEGYKRVCRSGAFLQFKTDNEELFEYSLEELAAADLVPAIVERDLHSSPLADNNIVTEYEEKFASQGIKIKYFLVNFT